MRPASARRPGRRRGEQAREVVRRGEDVGAEAETGKALAVAGELPLLVADAVHRFRPITRTVGGARDASSNLSGATR
jgi:hypothetical protein